MNARVAPIVRRSLVLLRRLRTRGTPLWAIGCSCMIAGLIVAPVIYRLDDRTRWQLLGFGPEGARAVASALSASMLSFVVFAFSILLLVAQAASAQLTPRIMRLVLEQRGAKFTLGALTFAWTYSLATVSRIETRVPQLPVALAIASSVICVALFLYLVQDTVGRMRPISVLMNVGRRTHATIEALYPRPFEPSGPRSTTALDARVTPAAASSCQAISCTARSIRHSGSPATVQGLDLNRLLSIASLSGCRIDVLPQVGDFVATGEELYTIQGAGAFGIDETALRECAILGIERSLEQDPAFGFRIIVDIASRALSPAVNDPTTAVLAIDQLQSLLAHLGSRQLDSGVRCDEDGRVLLCFPSPTWNDFLTLAVTEIRQFGGQSMQVTRRLQALFAALLQSLPHERAAAVREQRMLLVTLLEHGFPCPADRILALRGDAQGLGSPRHLR